MADVGELSPELTLLVDIDKRLKRMEKALGPAVKDIEDISDDVMDIKDALEAMLPEDEEE